MDDNGQVGQNHWSWWSAPRQNGFCLNQASAETLEKIRVALGVPPIVLHTDVITAEVDPEAVGAAIRAALGANRDKRV